MVDTPESLFSGLREALLWNHPDKVKRLLASGADPLAENEENAQLLTHAAIGNNPDLVRLMISLGCDPNHANINRRTPLHDAAWSGSTEAVHVLIEAGAKINVQDNRARTPLIEALRGRHPETAMALINLGVDIAGRDHTLKKSPLMWAVSMKSPELVRLILEKAGSELEVRDESGCTPLMHAARSGSPEMVRFLLDAGANIKARDKQGNDVFYWCSPLSRETALLVLDRSSFSPSRATKALLKAADEGHAEIVRILLSKKALIQPAEEGGESALVHAVRSRSADTLKTLLAHPSVQINYRSWTRLRTALATAAIKGDEKKFRILLDAGADSSITDADGKKAAHHAAANAHVAVLKILDEQGVDLLSTASGGRSLLHLAVYDSESFAREKDRAETVKWLLDKNIAPDTRDNSGITPLMLAALHACPEIVRLLVDAGADLDMTDNDGRTPLYHAVSHGTEYGWNERFTRPRTRAADKAAPVITALLEAGADPDKCPVLDEASRWRWPGAKALIKRFSAKKKQ